MLYVLFTCMLFQCTVLPVHAMDADCEKWLLAQGQEPPYALEYFNSVLQFAKWQDQQNILILRNQAGLAANEDDLGGVGADAQTAASEMSPILEAQDLDPLQMPDYAKIRPLIFSHAQIKKPAVGLTSEEAAPGKAYYAIYNQSFEIPVLRLGREYPMTYRLRPFDTEMKVAEVGNRVPVALLSLAYGAPTSHPLWVQNDLVGIQMRLEAAQLGLAPQIFGLVETPKVAFLATEIVAGSEVSGQTVGNDFAEFEDFLRRIGQLGWRSLTESVPLQLGPADSDLKFRVRGLEIGMIRTSSEKKSERHFLLTLREDNLGGGLIPTVRTDELSNFGYLGFPVEIQPNLNAINGRLTIQRAYVLSSMTVKQAVVYLEHLRAHHIDAWQSLIKLIHRHAPMLGARARRIAEKLNSYLLQHKSNL